MAEAYQNIDDQTLDLIKYPPLYPPEVEYISDYDYSSNNLRGKQFQFCYRYKYMGNMKSVFSPYSEVLIPQGEELPNGDFTPDFHLNNGILVKLYIGHHTVEDIEAAYRIGNNGNLYVFERKKRFVSQSITGTIHKDSKVMDNIGDWGGMQIKDLQVGMILKYRALASVEMPYIVAIDADNNSITLSIEVDTGSLTELNITAGWVVDSEYIYSIFRNDKVDYAVPAEEAIESFDRVPLSAKSFEVIESNRIVLGGPKLGYDNVDDMEITNEVIVSEIQEYVNKASNLRDYLFINYEELESQGTDTIYDYAIFVVPNTINENESIYANYGLLNRDTSIQFNISAYYIHLDTSIGAIGAVNYLKDKLVEQQKDENDKDLFSLFTLKEHIDAMNLAGIGAPLRIYYGTFGTFNSYTKGSIVRYNNPQFGDNLYVANSNTTSSADPARSVRWDYLCKYTDADKCLIMTTWKVTDTVSGNFFYTLGQLLTFSAEGYSSNQIYSSYKAGHKVNFAIEYFDYAGRLGTANHNSQLEINIPRLDEITPTSSIYSYNNLTNSIKLIISHKPPEWATGYRILMDKNVPWFQQFFFYGPAHATPDIVDDNLHINIKVNRSIQLLRDNFKKSIIVPYIFEKGDRIRLLAYKTQAEINDPKYNKWLKYNILYDSEIIGYDYPISAASYLKDDNDEYIKDVNGNKVKDESTGYVVVEKSSINLSDLSSAVYIIYEIYRPRKSTDENTLLYETHRTFAVGLPGEPQRYHSDPDLPFSTLQAEITLTSGNVYRKMRYSGEADIYFPVESLHASDYYESDSISIGRTNVISKDLGQIEEENGLVASGIVIEDTAINQLNKFPSANHWRLQSKHGTINALLEKGFILYAFQDIKVTSIYVGRNSMIDPADGSERVTLDSKAIFGTMRPDMSSDFGCADPKSICNSVSHVYFWDRNKSKWCRIAYNGIFPISDYGKRKHFTDLNALMGLTSNKHSISAYDIRYDELVISHKYIATDDYNIQFRALYTVGYNKFTNVGREDATDINIFEVGMIVTDMITSYDTPEINLTIVKIDARNRILYLDGVIPFATGVTGTITVDANVYKKHRMSTLAFHEAVNAWKTQFPFYPELMVSYGDKLLSFIHGRTYLHHEGNYGEFYDTTFEQFIQFAFNPGMVALFNGIELTADHAFGMVEKGDVTVLSDDMLGEDMESKLPSVRLRNVEGKYVASFLRDQNTPGSQTDVYKLVNGRFLRGQTIVLKMTNFEEEKVILFDVGLYFTQSL